MGNVIQKKSDEAFTCKVFKTRIQFGGMLDGMKVSFDGKDGVIYAWTPDEYEKILNHPQFIAGNIKAYDPVKDGKPNSLNPFEGIFSEDELFALKQLSIGKKAVLRENALKLLSDENIPVTGGNKSKTVNLEDELENDENTITDEDKAALLNDSRNENKIEKSINADEKNMVEENSETEETRKEEPATIEAAVEQKKKAGKGKAGKGKAGKGKAGK